MSLIQIEESGLHLVIEKGAMTRPAGSNVWKPKERVLEVTLPEKIWRGCFVSAAYEQEN